MRCRSRREFLAAAGAIGTGALAGCTALIGDDDASAEADLLQFRESWSWQGYLAPLVMAQEDGYWEERGITAQIRRGHGGAQTAREVGTGELELGIVDPGTVMSVIEEGLDLAVIGLQTTPEPSVAIGVEELEDTLGLTGAHPPGSSSAIMYDAIMENEGYENWEDDVDMEVTDQAQQLFLEGEVDFLLNWVTSIGDVWFDQENPMRPDVVTLRDYFPLDGNAFVAYEPWLEDNEETAAAFLDGAYEARKWMIENTAEGLEHGLEVLFETYPAQASGETAEEFHTAAAKVYNGGLLTNPSVREHGLGYIDKERAQDTVEFFEGIQTDGAVDFEDVYYDGLDTRLVESGDYMIDNIEEAEEFYSTIGTTLGMSDNDLIHNPMI